MFIYIYIYTHTFPESNIPPLKIDDCKMKSPFGSRPIFRGKVKLRNCSTQKLKKNDEHGVSCLTTSLDSKKWRRFFSDQIFGSPKWLNNFPWRPMIFWTGAPVVVEKPPAKQRVASATQPPWKMDQGSIKTDWFFPVTSNLELQWWIIFFWYSTLNIVLQFWMMDYIIKSPKQINPTTNSSKLWRLLFFWWEKTLFLSSAFWFGDCNTTLLRFFQALGQMLLRLRALPKGWKFVTGNVCSSLSATRSLWHPILKLWITSILDQS